MELIRTGCPPRLDRLQWVRNGLTLTTDDDYNSNGPLRKGRRRPTCRLYKNRPAGLTNRITQNHSICNVEE